MREWIAESDGMQEGHVFLARITRDGRVHGWQRVDMSGVADLVGEQMYASFIDELPDDLAFWVLTDKGVRPVKFMANRHDMIGFLEIILTWHDPKDPGKARVKETGYVKIPGA